MRRPRQTLLIEAFTAEAHVTPTGESPLAKQTYQEVLAVIRRDFDSLKREATEIRLQFGAVSPKFHMSLYALLMAAFAQADLFASLWRGSSRKRQTENLRAFLETFAQKESLAVALAVQLYRHTLMHTGRPRELRNDSTGQHHYFLLHWGLAVADPKAHFTVNESGKLTLNLESLFEDLDQALTRFCQAAANDATIQESIESVWPRIVLQGFSA